jgi:hypothetical protein
LLPAIRARIHAFCHIDGHLYALADLGNGWYDRILNDTGFWRPEYRALVTLPYTVEKLPDL